jgi:hypothetical protein
MKTARIPAFFLNRVQASELNARSPVSLFPRYPGAHKVLGVLLEVEAQLLGHAVLEIVSRPERVEE